MVEINEYRPLNQDCQPHREYAVPHRREPHFIVKPPKELRTSNQTFSSFPAFYPRIIPSCFPCRIASKANIKQNANLLGCLLLSPATHLACLLQPRTRFGSLHSPILRSCILLSICDNNLLLRASKSTAKTSPGWPYQLETRPKGIRTWTSHTLLARLSRTNTSECHQPQQEVTLRRGRNLTVHYQQ
jgi:hypothetical protein